MDFNKAFKFCPVCGESALKMIKFEDFLGTLVKNCLTN